MLADTLAALSPARDTAWDAGCGSGQLSVALAAQFKRVIATDPSQAQLDAAEAHPRVEYRCSMAEKSELPDASVDLAIAAQAAHWFDWPRYVAEVGRIARPGALVALVSYGNPTVDPKIDELITRYYHDDVGAYWPPGREHVEDGYQNLRWPWPRVEAPPIEMSSEWTRDELIGYIATWSATVRRIDDVGPARFDALRERISERWPGDEQRTVRWPLAIRLARR